MSSDDVVMAMVALREPVLPDAQKIGEKLQEIWPDAPAVEEPGTKDNAVLFRLGESTGVVALMPAPIPEEELEGPCAFAWYWPEAAEVLSQHTAHLVVIVADPPPNNIQRYSMLTQLVGATAAASDALAIYWGSAGLILDPGTFLEAGREMGPDRLPLELWISFRFDPQEDGSMSLVTGGMEQFGHKEIEINNSERDPQFIYERVFHIAHYLLENGPVIEDGQTVGMADDERFLVTQGPSHYDETFEVMHIDM